MPLIATVLDTVIVRGLWDFSQPLILAVSGGRDSMVMMDAFRRITPKPSESLIIAHIDHNARVDSHLDSDFVQHEAQKANLTFISTSILPWSSVNNLSPEEYWRKARYKQLQTIRTLTGASVIATAHTASDHLETLLLRLTAGTGPRGFLGIRLKRDDAIIRPLLQVSRSCVADYAKRNSITWREDPTNADLRRPRNAIRKFVIPTLEKLNPGVAEAAVKSSELLSDEDAVLSQSAHAILVEAGWTGHLPAILEQSVFSKSSRPMVRRCAAALYDGIFPDHRVTSDHIDRLSNCLVGNRSHCPLPNHSSAWNQKDKIIVLKELNSGDRLNVVDVMDAGEYEVGAYNIVIDRVSGETEPSGIHGDIFSIRTRRPSDTVLLRGWNQSKPLKEHMREIGIPSKIRDHLPLVVDSEGTVRWISFFPESTEWFFLTRSDRWFKLTCYPRSAIRWNT